MRVPVKTAKRTGTRGTTDAVGAGRTPCRPSVAVLRARTTSVLIEP